MNLLFPHRMSVWHAFFRERLFLSAGTSRGGCQQRPRRGRSPACPATSAQPSLSRSPMELASHRGQLSCRRRSSRAGPFPWLKSMRTRTAPPQPQSSHSASGQTQRLVGCLPGGPRLHHIPQHHLRTCALQQRAFLSSSLKAPACSSKSTSIGMLRGQSTERLPMTLPTMRLPLR